MRDRNVDFILSLEHYFIHMHKRNVYKKCIQEMYKMYKRNVFPT